MRNIILTSAELIIADFILSNSVAGEQISVVNKMTGILDIGIYNKYPGEATEIIRVVKKREKNIRKFLMQERYILSIDHLTKGDMLTNKGLHAQKLGGHKKYVEWEKSEKNKSGIKAVASKKSYFSDSFKFINPLNLVTVLGKIKFSKDKGQSKDLYK